MILIFISIAMLLFCSFKKAVVSLDLEDYLIGLFICSATSFLVSALIGLISALCISNKYITCEKMIPMVDYINASIANETLSIINENDYRCMPQFKDIVFTKDVTLTNSLMRVVSLIEVPQTNWLLEGWISSSVEKTTVFYGAPFFVIKEDVLIKYE
jgi:ABC-type uncharacterized transport system permease subunit